MSKKIFLLELIKTFEENAGSIPSDLQNKLEEIKGKIHSSTDEELEREATSVETEPATLNQYEPDKLYSLLYEVFPEMEKIAKTSSENQYELMQATNELRGELGLATDPPFPE